MDFNEQYGEVINHPEKMEKEMLGITYKEKKDGYDDKIKWRTCLKMQRKRNGRGLDMLVERRITNGPTRH